MQPPSRANARGTGALANEARIAREGLILVMLAPALTPSNTMQIA